MEITYTRPLTISHLIRSFKKVNFPVSASWVRRQEDKGNLVLPRSTTNFKMARGARRLGAVRQMTPEQVEQIILAFLPEGTRLPNGKVANGKGYFNYKKAINA